MYDYKIHSVEEFPNLPWGTLDSDQCTRSWSFGSGGHGLLPSTMTISIYNGNDVDDTNIWVLPDALAAMFKIAKEAAVEEALRKVRNALGVD